MRRVAMISLSILLVASGSVPSKPGPREKCPVCGMFVARYPDWIAEVVLRDGTRLHFDGPKDMIRFWLDPARFLPSRNRGELESAFVTDYYALTSIDACTAFFVLGSDVLGPMGRELIPFAKRAEAEEFLHDHGGSRIVAFDDVTAELLEGLDR